MVGGGKMEIRKSKADRMFDFINYIILGVVLLTVLYPLYFIIIASISDPVYVQAGKVLFWPKKINIDGYKEILKNRQVWIGYGNTFFYSILGVAASVTLTMLTAYPLSRKNFKLRGVVMAFLMFTMYFNGGLIPTYMLIKNLGLLDTRAVIILIGMINVFNVIIARTFLANTIPEEIYEASVIDGCSHFQYFTKVVMPLSKAILAVLALYYGIALWNDYFKGLIYLSDPDKYPLQMVLKNIFAQTSAIGPGMDDELVLQRIRLQELMKYGLIIVSTGPVLILYPYLQKYFVKGAMIGSVKG